VCVISRHDAHERRSLIVRNFSAVPNFKYRFHNALGAEDEVDNLISSKKAQISAFGRPLTDGEIGCYKSHYSLILDFERSSTAEWLVVFEDDVWFDIKFDLKNLVSLAELRKISYIRLFARKYKRASWVAKLNETNELIRFHTDPYGTQAYIINKGAANRFLRSIKSIDRPIDDDLGRFWRHGLAPYCVFPFPVVEQNLGSSLSVLRMQAEKIRRKSNFNMYINRISERLNKEITNFSITMHDKRHKRLF
jgi:glycosyl transferase family 25